MLAWKETRAPPFAPAAVEHRVPNLNHDYRCQLMYVPFIDLSLSLPTPEALQVLVGALQWWSMVGNDARGSFEVGIATRQAKVGRVRGSYLAEDMCNRE